MGKEITQSGTLQASTRQRRVRIRFPRRFAELPHLEITYTGEGAQKSIPYLERSPAWFEVSPRDAATLGKVIEKPCSITWTATGEVNPRWHALVPLVALVGGVLGIYATLVELGQLQPPAALAAGVAELVSASLR